MKIKYITIIAFVLAIAVSSCNIVDGRRINGNGKVTTKTYDLKNFSQIDVGHSMKVYLSQGNNYEVKIETDENLFDFLNVRVDEENVLDVDVANNTNLDATGEIKVYITAPSLDQVELSGAAEIETKGKFAQDKKIKFDISGASSGNISVRAPMVELDASGASTLTVDGESKDIEVDASGASTINAFDLMSENAAVESSGASTARVFSSIALNARANGASTIKYKGNPKVTSDASGASSITKE